MAPLRPHKPARMTLGRHAADKDDKDARAALEDPPSGHCWPPQRASIASRPRSQHQVLLGEVGGSRPGI
eukprot:5685143-Pyramimonas_sp.AAC.1